MKPDEIDEILCKKIENLSILEKGYLNKLFILMGPINSNTAEVSLNSKIIVLEYKDFNTFLKNLESVNTVFESVSVELNRLITVRVAENTKNGLVIRITNPEIFARFYDLFIKDDSALFWFTIDKESGDIYFDSKKVLFNRGIDQTRKILYSVLSLIPEGGEINFNDIKKHAARKNTDFKKIVQKSIIGESSNLLKVKSREYIKFKIREHVLFQTRGEKLLFNNKK